MHPNTRLTPHHYQRVIVLCLALIVLGSVIGIALPAGLGWDFANFYDAGRRVAAGEFHHLYHDDALIAGEEPQGNMRFYSVPLSGFFYVPLTSFGPRTASILFKTQGFAALAIGLWVLYLHTRQYVTPTDESRWQFATWFAALTLVYQPFWTIYRVGGQTTPTIVLLLVAAMLSYLHGRTWMTAILLTLVILIKPAFVMSTGLLAIASGINLCLALAACGAVAGGLSIWLAGYQPHVEFLDLMLVSSKTSFNWLYNSAATVAIENLRMLDDPRPARYPRPAALTRWIDAARLVFGVTFLVLAWRIKRVFTFQREVTGRLFLYLASLVFGVALIPITWEHYLSVLFLPLIHVVAVRDRLPRAARWITGSALALACVQNLVLIEWWYHHWQINTVAEAILAGLAKGGPCLLTMLLFAKYHRALGSAWDDLDKESQLAGG